MHLIHFEKSASENDIIRLYLFRLQTISGNPFTPFRVFGCTWKIEFFIYFDHKIRPLTRKMNAAFVLPSNHFQAHRRAKRERESELDRAPTPDTSVRLHRLNRPTEIVPQHWCRHLDLHHPRPISFSTQSLSASSFLFSFSTQSSSTPPISSSQSHHP